MHITQIIGGALWAACLLAGAAQAALPADAAAQIVSLQGQGEQRQTDAVGWSAAKPLATLSGGAFVRTLAASKMALLFADDTQLRLNQNSLLQVKQVDSQKRESTLLLNLGRAWAQSKRPAGGRLNFETPAATAGIRGTEWELDVDASGTTLLTVFSGTVEFANAQGQLTVNSQEAAMAEVGRAPVKIVLSNPRQRIQWVSALSADPLRHLDANQIAPALQPALKALGSNDLAAARIALAQLPAGVSGDGPVLLHAALATLAGQTGAAQQSLQGLLAQPGVHPDAAYLLLSDLQLVQGDFDAAARVLQTGLQQRPQAADLLAQLARTQLLADQLTASEQTLAQARDADSAAVWLAQGELARRQGLSAATLQAYTRATRVAPQDDRGWFGLGSAQAELEQMTPARSHLAQALTLQPQGAGYQGELGTLETFVNRFGPAEQAFTTALAHNPADYVALTGLGLLRLKQGQPQAALDALLRAGVMEPRYARAKAYTAVAYYQMGRHSDALEALQQASQLDDKDPLPYLLQSQIHTDLLQPGEAVQAARAAVQRLPYLKSLNQLANNQKGSANLGASLAFFGLEEWALELAQRSQYPYWGGSHLFLADRRPGEFNKNSELFQGFLTDPLAFGASNRFSSLLQRAGHYGSLGVTYDKTAGTLSSPSLTLNGLSNQQLPVAYFVQTQPAHISHYPIDLTVLSGQPTMEDPTGRASVDARVNTLGLGLQLTEQLGLFAYYNGFQVRLTGHNQVVDFAADTESLTRPTALELDVSHSALGLSYRWGAQSQTWLKLGSSRSANTITAYPTVFVLGDAVGEIGVSATPDKHFEDLQVRHTVDLNAATRLSVGLETVRESQNSLAQGSGAVGTKDATGVSLSNILLFFGSNDIQRDFTALTLAGQQRLSPGLTLDAALAVNRMTERIHGESLLINLADESVKEDSVHTDQQRQLWAPRVGLMYQPDERFSLRAAYQDWVRPLSVDTLNSTDTAGIGIEDRLLQAGGRVKRSVLQLGWTLDDTRFVSARLDHQRINNPESPGVDLRTPSLPFLESLRNAQSFNLSSLALLEGDPEVGVGTLKAFSLAVNQLLSRQLSGYSQYALQESSNSYADTEAPGGRVSDKRIAYLPRHTLALGLNWAAPQRLQLGARAVYRSERFEDAANATRWPGGWQLDLLGSWESSDKRFGVTAGALNLGGAKSPRETERFVVDARYRF